MPTWLEHRKDDGHAWHFNTSMAMLVRLAKRGEAYCGTYTAPHCQCREPAAVISELGDGYCAKHFGRKQTQRLRELEAVDNAP